MLHYFGVHRVEHVDTSTRSSQTNRSNLEPFQNGGRALRDHQRHEQERGLRDREKGGPEVDGGAVERGVRGGRLALHRRLLGLGLRGGQENRGVGPGRC